jgi:hypothetical protein
LDKKLQIAAEKAGHSVTEEIHRRLEDSFKRTEDIYGGPHTSAMFRVIADSIALLKTGGSLAETDRARANVATFFVDLLAKEVPGLYSVTIETVNEQGQVRGVTGYPSEEIAKRDHPGLAEILRARRAAIAPPATKTQRDESK